MQTASAALAAAFCDHRRPRRRHEQHAAREAGQNDLGIPSTCSPMYDRIRFVEIGAT